MSKVGEYYEEAFNSTNWSIFKSDQEEQPAEPEGSSMIEELTEHYWCKFLELIKTSGQYAWIYKLDHNAAEGVYPTMKVKKDYFKTEAHFQQCKQDRKKACWRSFNELNDLAEALGLETMSTEEGKDFLNQIILVEKGGSGLTVKSKRIRRRRSCCRQDNFS
ncbi:hypothetical protein IJG78_02580 [Candidatus Saccharibacteria bacterium]|nr:hypothetical protein [Candidatus Saccharibacteria bacterium]